MVPGTCQGADSLLETAGAAGLKSVNELEAGSQSARRASAETA